uniref:BET1-like protein n=5 Tax=Passeriformes TaxID=9126 RepID=A0A8C9N1J4_SERCA
MQGIHLCFWGNDMSQWTIGDIPISILLLLPHTATSFAHHLGKFQAPFFVPITLFMSLNPYFPSQTSIFVPSACFFPQTSIFVPSAYFPPKSLFFGPQIPNYFLKTSFCPQLPILVPKAPFLSPAPPRFLSPRRCFRPQPPVPPRPGRALAVPAARDPSGAVPALPPRPGRAARGSRCRGEGGGGEGGRAGGHFVAAPPGGAGRAGSAMAERGRGQSPSTMEDLLDVENKRMADSLASKVTRLKSLALDIDKDAEEQNRYLDGMDSDFLSVTGLLTGSVKRFSGMARSGRDNRRLLLAVSVALILIFFILYYLVSRAGT